MKEKYTKYSKNMVLLDTERGRKLLKVEEVKEVKYWNNIPLMGKTIQPIEIISNLDEVGSNLEKVEAVLHSLDTLLAKEIEFYFENNTEAKEEFNKLFSLLDIARDNINSSHTIVNITNTRILSGVEDE